MLVTNISEPHVYDLCLHSKNHPNLKRRITCIYWKTYSLNFFLILFNTFCNYVVLIIGTDLTKESLLDIQNYNIILKILNNFLSCPFYLYTIRCFLNIFGKILLVLSMNSCSLIFILSFSYVGFVFSCFFYVFIAKLYFNTVHGWQLILSVLKFTLSS